MAKNNMLFLMALKKPVENIVIFLVIHKQKHPARYCLALLIPLQNSNSFIETLDQPDIVWLPPDIVWNLSLSPTASFFRELYKYTSTFNGSIELAIAILC
jgi:hypothetical protein